MPVFEDRDAGRRDQGQTERRYDHPRRGAWVS
jgi:hypothetical protein